MEIRVIKDSGRQISFFEALASNLLRVVDALPAAYLAEVISIPATKQNKRLGGLVAGTIVVHEATDEFGGCLSIPASRSFTSSVFKTPAAPAPVASGMDRIVSLA